MPDTKKKSTPAKPSLVQSKFETVKNGNLEITITLPWSMVGTAYKKALDKLTAKTTLKGFREGKAPQKMVEEHLGKQKIYEEMIPDLLTQAYVEAIKNHKLMPIVNPKFQLTKSEDKKDWELVATTAQLPKVELGDYKAKIKKEMAPEKIWVPGKDDPKKKPQEDPQEKMSKIFQALLKSQTFQIPEILVEEETNRLLSRLIDQTSRLGLTVEQYLQSIGKDIESLKKEYHQQAEDSIRLELTLSAIANQEQIKVEDKEIEEMIAATGDENVKKQLQDPNQKRYLTQILRKRKVVDLLSAI